MGKAVTAAHRPDVTQPGAGTIYRRLFGSFNPDSGGQISPLEVMRALRRIARRKPSPRTGRQVPVAGPAEAASVLTPRELDVLRLVAQGLTNPGIARQLVLSDHTVHRHLANIFRKLNLSSRAAVAAWGVRSGLV
jgi:DNA-binding NarL/FixJ family response regulator